MRRMGYLFVLLAASSGCAMEVTDESELEVDEVSQNLDVPVSVTTRAYNLERTGANTQESILTPANVKASANSFGKLFDLRVDDQVYAQPLYMANLSMGGSTRNVVYVATVRNTIHAFDADGGSPLWSVNYTSSHGNGAAAPFTGDLPAVVGQACGGKYSDFGGRIGIVGTPVIGGPNNRMYYVSRAVLNGTHSYRLNMIDIVNGNLVGSTSIVGFDAGIHNQRAGLALRGNNVYVAFGAYCDAGEYRGRILAFDTGSLAQVASFIPSPGSRGAGIWQAGAAPAIDASGNVYVATGNGYADDGTTNFGQSILKLTSMLKLDKPASPSTVVNSFTPNDFGETDAVDGDLGSAGPSLMPGGLLVNGSKAGKVYLLDTSNLRGIRDIRPLTAVLGPASESRHIHNQVVVWSGPNSTRNMYVWGENDRARRYQLRSDNTFESSASAVGMVTPPNGMPGGNMALSSSGTSNGILWATIPAQGDANHNSVPGALYAVDAMTLQALWDSNRVQDDIRTLTKGSGPLVVNGKVYVPSLSRTVAVFGARTGPTPTIKQGVYQIRTSLGSDKCVDVAGGSTADKADIQQYGCNGTDAQRWWISNYSGDIYTISSMRSGKCLDVELAAPGDKIRVQQFACNSTVAQRWRIVPIGNGKYELRPQTTTPNKCLDVAGGLPNDSTKLQQFGCNQTNSQRFTLALDGVSAFGEGTYSITTATGPNLCLDVDLGQYADNIDVQQYNCNGTYSQRWHFRQITGNTYEVRAAVSNKCLDVSWGDPAPGAGIQQYECNDTGAQQWQISPAGTGRFRFSPLTAAAGTNCLDVVDRSSASPASLQQYSCNGTPAQLFGIIAP